MTISSTVAKHKQYLFPAVSMYYQEPIALVKGEGAYVWDDAGRKYLDAFGGVLTVSVGHANPKVTAAIVEQVKTLSHTSTLYANKPQSDLAEKLTSNSNLSRSFRVLLSFALSRSQSVRPKPPTDPRIAPRTPPGSPRRAA